MKRLAGSLLLVALAGPVAAEQAGPFEWTGVERVVAVGDVHGADEKLAQLLEGVDLMDESGNWIGGASHLVMVGDLIDRGRGDRAVLDLLRRLQEQAAASGGRVHVLLGNHEILNLVRDLRYVNTETYADFAGEEDERSRKQAFKRFKRGYDGDAAAAAFDAAYPRGYFGRIAAFESDGEYGEWLLRRPVVVKINDALFVHGGLTERMAALGLEEINDRARSELEKHLKARRRLEVRGIVDSLMTFREAQEAAYRFFERNSRIAGAGSWVRAAADFGLLPESEFFGADGPLWYRGNSTENEVVERDRLERTLERLSARVLVVAHSPTGGETITSRFGGRLYRIDHGMTYGERPLALVMQQGMAMVFDPGVETLLPPQPEPWQGESPWANNGTLTEAQVIALLNNGEVVRSRELGRGSTRPKLVELAYGDTRMRAIFKFVDEKPASPPDGKALDRYRHEVAAYRLDRLLGLGLVPVTVVRSLDGVEGSMQQWVERAVDGETKAAHKLEASDPEQMERQSAVGLVFEYLVGNASSSKSDLLYLLEENRVMCVDHSRAFPTSPLEAKLAGEVSRGLLDALRGLDASKLQTELGDLLNAGQIEALLARRDRILARFVDAAAGRRQRAPAVRAQTLVPRGSLAGSRARAEAQSSPQSWTKERKEAFLLNARIVSTKDLGTGITRPKKVTLELDGVTLPAVFKYHDEFRPGVTQFDAGPREVNFRDSYLFDRAAYLLDRELELDMVPPVVLREVERKSGALIWWIPDSITEVERFDSKIMPGDPRILSRQRDVARIFHALVENTDLNLNNQLLTVHDWRLYLIDQTRAFRFSKDLRKEFLEKPVTLPRALYRQLQGLERDRLITVMKGVLSKVQVRALLARRDAILDKIGKDIETHGEAAVFQD